MNLQGKVCVVTGASSGIGRRVALDLAERGASVVVAARRGERLADLVEELGGEGAGHSLCVTDVASRTDVAALARHVEERHGRCDVLVNNAGISLDGFFEGPDDIDRVERIMATNFNGVVYCTGELLPLLIASAPSHIVNLASMAGRLGLGGATPYCASKFAVVGWSEALRAELAARDVYVACIQPGFVPTEGFPHDDFQKSPVMRRALTSVERVSAAVLDAIDGRKAERVVPRWYRLFELPRLLAPPLYSYVARKMIEPVQRKRLARAPSDRPS